MNSIKIWSLLFLVDSAAQLDEDIPNHIAVQNQRMNILVQCRIK